MDRSRSARRRSAIDDYLIDDEAFEARDLQHAGRIWEDMSNAEPPDLGAELDDQELEIARLLGREFP